jgi:hypothetical protein
VRCVTAGDSKNAPARGARGGNASPGRAERYSSVSPARDVRRRDLAIPPEPSAVTGDGIQRSSAVPSVRSAPGLGQITGRGGPGRGADAAEPHVPGSQRSRAVCSAGVAWRNGLLQHQHRSIGRRNHDDVTSSWSGPLQSHIVVVTRTTPSRVHALRRGYRAVQVAPRQPRDARDARDRWCRVGSGGGGGQRRGGDKTSGGAGTMAKRPAPRRGRPLCALVRRCAWLCGALGSGGALGVRRWLRLGRRPGCGSCWGRPGCRGPSWW